MESGLILEYTLHPDGAHLVRALGETPCPALPDTLGGLPLVQIGDYAFSASQHKVLPKGEVHTAQIGTPPPAAQPLCGNFLQAVRLPQPLQQVGWAPPPFTPAAGWNSSPSGRRCARWAATCSPTATS